MTTGGGGMSPFGDAGDLLARLQSLQADLASAQAAAGSRTVEGQAGAGAVRVVATGELSFTEVHIDPSVVDPGDVALLEDLLLAALRDLATRLEELRRQEMGTAVSNALGGLFGAFGEPGDLDDENLDDEDLDDEDDEDLDDEDDGDLDDEDDEDLDDEDDGDGAAGAAGPGPGSGHRPA